jgi:DNA-binding transcriptional MerR regulator
MATAKRKHALAPAEVVIPEKIYFRIGEVSELAKLPTYVLRFWETEFPQLRPTKSSTGQRMYRRRDVEFVMQIRKLLYEDGFTIAGARERLREQARSNREPQAAASEGLIAAQAPVLASDVAKGAARERNGLQAVLFPAPVAASADREQRMRELHHLRRQLSEVLELLS